MGSERLRAGQPGALRAASRSTTPKYASAPAGSISHNGRPSHALICSRCVTSELIVPSARPAAARASTNPASTSVSNAASSSAPAGTRASRRISYDGQVQPGCLLAFTDPAIPVINMINLQGTRDILT